MNDPNQKTTRYVRIPIPLKRDSSQLKKSLTISKLITLHKNSIVREKKKLGVSDYGLLWISFFRGIIVAVVAERILFH